MVISFSWLPRCLFFVTFDKKKFETSKFGDHEKRRRKYAQQILWFFFKGKGSNFGGSSNGQNISISFCFTSSIRFDLVSFIRDWEANRESSVKAETSTFPVSRKRLRNFVFTPVFGYLLCCFFCIQKASLLFRWFEFESKEFNSIFNKPPDGFAMYRTGQVFWFFTLTLTWEFKKLKVG